MLVLEEDDHAGKPNMVTLLRAFCRKCCRTAETADMANAVLILAAHCRA